MKPKHPRKWFLFALIIVFLFTSIPVWAGEEGVVTGSVVNLREGAGLNNSIVTKTEAGQGLTVLGRSGDWLQVRLYNGNEGWIHKDLVEIKNVLKMIKVTDDVVNLRKGPDTSYSKAGQVKAGQILPVYAEKNSWYQIQAPGVGQAWIAGWLTSVHNTTSQTGTSQNTTQQKYGKIMTDVLNVRSGPGTNYTLLTKIGLNEVHEIVEQKEGWYKIKVGEQLGWVTADYVELVSAPVNNTENQPTQDNTYAQTVVVTGGTVNIRQQAVIDAKVIAKVNAGERLAITAKQGDWLEVKLYDGTKGWIAEWLTEPTTATTSSRGSILESEVLIAPIAEGKAFKIIDSAGRPILLLEGWTSDQYQISSSNDNKIILELDGPTERNYEGKNTRLGIQGIKIYPKAQKAVIEVSFSFAPTQSISYDEASKKTRIQLGTKQTKGLTGKVIVVDPGHSSIQPGGWLDPGALGKYTGLKEKDVNTDIAFKLKKLLEEAGAGVIMTHTGQTELSLAARAGLANSANADIFVSVHANYSLKNNISGHSTYYYAPTNDAVLNTQKYSRQKLATLVQRELVIAGGRKDMGVLTANFAVLRETRVPSILVETAFLSDVEEEKLLGTEAYRQKLAIGIFNGIKAYFE